MERWIRSRLQEILTAFRESARSAGANRQSASRCRTSKDIRLAAWERERKMNMAAFDGMAPKPSFTDKLQSLRPAVLALPELPRIRTDRLISFCLSIQRRYLTDEVAALTGPGGPRSAIALGAGGTGDSQARRLQPCSARSQTRQR